MNRGNMKMFGREKKQEWTKKSKYYCKLKALCQ